MGWTKRQRNPRRLHGSWRSYQASLKRRESARRRKRSLVKGFVLCLLAVAVGLAATLWLGPAVMESGPAMRLFAEHEASAHTGGGSSGTPWGRYEKWCKLEAARALARADLAGKQAAPVHSVIRNGHCYRFETSIDQALQARLEELMERSRAVHAGIAVMEPCTGRVLAMAGRTSDPGVSPVFARLYPAASVFKIVTAAAAMEVLELTPDSSLTYRGRKHTLYKYQLKDKAGRGSHKISLRDSFAQSVNPVFGKLGANALGKPPLDAYARGFGFNLLLDFELPMAASEAPVGDEHFNLAEIASGFNRTTRMTPLHGAALVSAVLNGGILPEPSLVDRVVRDDGLEVYSGKLAPVSLVASPATCAGMQDMMVETVRTGTARRHFRSARRDRVLSHLTMGGKTGSINSRDDALRYDWFVGFAEDEDGRAVAVAAVVAHGEYLGTRSMEYAQEAVRTWFSNLDRGES